METHEILEKVKSGEVSIEDAEKYFKRKPFEDMGYAKIDTHREIRSGFPEVVFCSRKADEHLIKIYQTLYNESEIKTEIQTGVQKSLMNELMVFSKKYDKIKSEIKLLEENKVKLERQRDTFVEKLVLLEKINLALDTKNNEKKEQKSEEERIKKIFSRAALAKILGIGTIYKGTEISVQAKEITLNNNINHVYFSNDKIKGVVAKR